MSEQIFSMDENSLFWKHMSKRIFMYKEVKSMLGFNPLKDRITIFLLGNVTGYKLKFFVTWHVKTLRPLRILISTQLMYYRSNKKSQMTQMVFQDVLMNFVMLTK